MLISRSEALKQGLTYYLTGKPCLNGHVCRRFVSSYTCEECAAFHKARYRKDPEKHAKEMAYKAAYRDENRERINEYASNRWRDCPSARQINKESKERNRDKINARQRVDNMTAEQVLRSAEYRRRSYERNRGKRIIAAKAGAASRKGAFGKFSSVDVQLALDLQSWKCLSCDQCLKAGYDVDHIVPISKGGSNLPINLQILCPRCNRKKSAKMPVDWAISIGRPDLAKQYLEVSVFHGRLSHIARQQIKKPRRNKASGPSDQQE